MNATLRRRAHSLTHGSTLDSAHLTLTRTIASLLVCLGVVSGCSSSSSGDSSAAGGAPASSGGKSAAVGGGNTSAASGGTSASAGGAVGSGGSSGGAQGTGGANSAGGSKATGGANGAGGPSSGGANNAGGSKATGGANNAGGSSSGGANSGGSSAGSAGSTGSAGANGGTAGAASGSTAVENASADCQVSALPEPSALPKISKLPDPFKKLDGTRIATKAEWRCRRQEIRKQAEKYILGEKPSPDVVTGSVTSSKISVHVEAKGKSIDFTASVVLPKGQPPFPALINVGSSGMTLGESRILDQGVAVIYYNNYDIGKEGTAEQSRGKPNPGKYYDIYGGKDPAGLLIAWAWGASRLLDVIQKSDGSILIPSSIGVTGCSRFGKGAFTIGVFDDRIALTIPQEPSTGGDPALRIMDVISGAERTDYNYNGLNWLSDNFAPFVYSNNTSNAVKLPLDTHALVAMIAPRGLLVLENPHQTQMGAPAGHMATLAGAEVYKALGVEKNVSYHSSVADTAHCSYKTEYTDLLVKNINAFLKHTADPPGEFKVGSGGSLTRADWIDWTTPTLQ